MAQLLNISRAARLAGVSRRQLQTKIRSGDLQTFEGKVQVTDLLRVFPEIDLDHDPALEKLEQIKADAHQKFHWQQSEPPGVEILMRRLQTLSGLLVQTKGALDQKTELLDNVALRLEDLESQESLDAAARDRVRALHHWLAKARDNRDQEPDSAAILFTKNLLLHIVAPSVQLIPSGHEFLVEGGDTILDAAIRSGNNVRYGCNDATCGSCKGRVISGQTIEVRTPNHPLGDHEKQLGYMLMCCNTAVTDLMLEAAETPAPADLPRQSIETTVSSVQALSEGASLLQLKTPKSQNFRYFAGQRADLTLAGGATAPFPMASCPCDREYLHFVVGRRPEDQGSVVDFAGLQSGETVTVTGPEGDFVLRQGAVNRSLFIACDGGFAPIKSLIEHAISIDRIEAFHLYRFASPGTAAFYHNLCRTWEDAFDNFTYTSLELGGDPGLTVSRIVDDLPELSSFDIYVAGPRRFTDAAREALIEAGLSADRMRFEVVPG